MIYLIVLKFILLVLFLSVVVSQVLLPLFSNGEIKTFWWFRDKFGKNKENDIA